MATGLVGGYNGRYLERLLEEDGVAHQFGKIQGETRSCINILDPAFGSTEYLESGAEISADEETVFVEKVFPLAIAALLLQFQEVYPKVPAVQFISALSKGLKQTEKSFCWTQAGRSLKKAFLRSPFW